LWADVIKETAILSKRIFVLKIETGFISILTFFHDRFLTMSLQH